MTELATAAAVSPLSLLSASPDGVLAYDRECRITFWNPAMERLSGVPAVDAVGRCCDDVLPLLRELGEPALAEAALAGEVAVGPDWELTVPATGERVWVEARYAPVRDEAGEVCGCVATLREVGDRHRAAAAAEARGASAMEALRRSEERYRTLVESGTQMVWTTDARGMVIDMPFWRELTGQSLEEVREVGWASAIHPDDRERVLAAWWGAYETRTVYKAEYRLRLADGSYRWFLARGAPVLEPDGGIREWVGAFNDVHDRRLAEAALRESEERYRLAMLATRDVVWDWDLATDEVRFGDSIRQVLGFRPGDVAPDANWWYDHIHADDRDRVVASVHEAIQSRAEVWMDSYRHLRADGSWAQVEDRAFLLYGEDGRPVRMVGATQDVTERRLAEAARENERLRLRRVLAQMPAAVSVHEGPELVFVALSDAMRRLMGGRDVLGQPARAAIPELASQGFVDELERVYRTGERFTQTSVSAWWDGDGDGVAEEHVVDYAYEPLLDGEGHVYGVVSHVAEVTGRERAARELADARREAEARADEAARLARELAEKAEALQVRVDESRRLAAELRTANHDLRAASTRAEEARGRLAVIAEASSRLAASLEYRETVRTVARLAVPVVADWCFVEVLEDDGSIPLLACAHSDPEMVELAVETLRRHPIDPDAPHGTAKVLRTGEPEVMLDVPPGFAELMGQDEWHREVLRRVGFRSYVSVPLSAGGRTFGVLSLVQAESGRRFGDDDVAFVADLANRAAAAIENARLYEEALAANRAKDGFLATMSHELRTPLNAMIGYVDLLLMGIPDPIPVSAQAYVERIRLASRHLLSIIEEILTFSRIEAGRETPEVEEVDLAVLAREVSAIIDPLAREKGLLFHVPVEVDPPTLRTDPRKLRQILVNLLGNAVKFTHSGSVGFAVERGDGAVLLRVRDTGIGIAPEFHETVFEPFRQVDNAKTRTVAGTGLGLTVSRELARLLGGDVTLVSGIGEGSVFTVRLPARDDAP